MSTVNPIKDGETTGFPQTSPEEIAAASYYQEKLVPALFKDWPPLVIEAAQISNGDRVLDIACGTGVATRQVAAITGKQTPPAGLDIAPGMLSVAHSINPEIDWRQGSADALPFADNSFDRVICQYGLMFFPDAVKALQEMLRVLIPGGRLAVAVWNTLNHNPGSTILFEILQKLAGDKAAQALSLPYRLGDIDELSRLAEIAGVKEFELSTYAGRARFTALQDLIDAEIRGWLPIMGVNLQEDLIQQIHNQCDIQLSKFIDAASGKLDMPTSAHILSGEG